MTQEGHGGLVLEAYPSSTGAQRVLFTSEGEDDYAAGSAGPERTRTSTSMILFHPAPHKAARGKSSKKSDGG